MWAYRQVTEAVEKPVADTSPFHIVVSTTGRVPVASLYPHIHRSRGHGNRTRHNQTRVRKQPTIEQILRGEMWRQAYHDPEQSETVNLHNYELLDIWRGDVLCQGRYRHPKL